MRYRGEDIARGITKKVVREARAKELKAELLNSEVRDGGDDGGENWRWREGAREVVQGKGQRFYEADCCCSLLWL